MASFTFPPINVSCADVNESVSTWGGCIKEVMFFGDTIIFAMFLYLLFALIIYRSKVPIIASVPLFTFLNWGLYLLDPNPIILGLAYVSTIILGIWMAYAILFKTLIK